MATYKTIETPPTFENCTILETETGEKITAPAGPGTPNYAVYTSPNGNEVGFIPSAGVAVRTLERRASVIDDLINLVKNPHQKEMLRMHDPSTYYTVTSIAQDNPELGKKVVQRYFEHLVEGDEFATAARLLHDTGRIEQADGQSLYHQAMEAKLFTDARIVAQYFNLGRELEQVALEKQARNVLDGNSNLSQMNESSRLFTRLEDFHYDAEQDQMTPFTSKVFVEFANYYLKQLLDPNRERGMAVSPETVVEVAGLDQGLLPHASRINYERNDSENQFPKSPSLVDRIKGWFS